MSELKKKKNFDLRGILLFPIWLCMVGVAVYYLWSTRHFLVDDQRFNREITEAAAKYGLDSRLVKAVIFEESHFKANEIGKAGEIGLMQIMPKLAAADWARAHKKAVPSRGELFSPELNLEIGCWFLRDGLERFKDYDCALELALARYNAGLKRARKWAPEDKKAPVLDRITISSTRKYVANITKRYQRYCEESK